MRTAFLIVPSLLICLAVAVAIAPLGAPGRATFVLPLLPYMVAHIFVARGKGFVPSPLMFCAGLAVDMAGDGPLGFWPMIYLLGLLIARQLPTGLAETRFGRLSGMLLVVFALAAAQVALASLYQFRLVDWHAVLAGTVIAGLIASLLDLVWPTARSTRPINVTDRGAAGGAGNV